MIPKFRVAFKNKILGEVGSIDFVDETVTIPVYDKETDEYLADYELSLNSVTLMQSTGMFDVNGKEIFEGDKIIYNRDDYTVVRIDAAIGLAFIKNGEKTSFKPLVNGMINFDRVEVIGNIYQNPELVDELE